GPPATGRTQSAPTVGPPTGIPGLQPGKVVIALASIAMDNFGDASELSPAVRVDAAPQVAQIYVNGSGWAQRFRDYLVRSRIGSASYGLALTPDFFTQPPTEVSWVNVDEIGVRFTEDVRIKREDVIVQGERLNGYGVDLHYDPTTFTATLRLSRTIPFDRITVQLDAGPTGVAARDDGAA